MCVCVVVVLPVALTDHMRAIYMLKLKFWYTVRDERLRCGW